MSEMADFATAIRSLTQGRGYFTFDFARYEQLPSNLEAKTLPATSSCLPTWKRRSSKTPRNSPKKNRQAEPAPNSRIGLVGVLASTSRHPG